MSRKNLRFLATDRAGEVSAVLVRPRGARALLVLGHGAGAGMRHPFLESMAGHLAVRGVATLRYQFPYMEAGKRAPDRQPVLLRTVRAAVATAAREASDLPLLAGGKSMGGRMTSLAASKEPLEGVRGLVFLGFPLHPAGKPASGRGDHLEDVDPPMLFLQGTRDRLSELDLLRPLLERLPRATLHVVEDADHSFEVPKRAGRSNDDVHDELADAIAAWALEV